MSMDSSNMCPMKITEHMKLTRKFIRPLQDQKKKRSLRKIVRIRMTDLDATDSSSDEEGEEFPRQRVKKYLNVIRVETCIPPRNKKVWGKTKMAKKPGVDPTERKYRGVRARPWGTFTAEIRDRRKQTRLWLGTYKTPIEAAMVYDTVAIDIHGAKATINFGIPSRVVNQKTIIEPISSSKSEEGSHNNTLASPTYVLRNGNKNQSALKEAKKKEKAQGKGKKKVEIIEFFSDDEPCSEFDPVNNYMPMEMPQEDDYGFGSTKPISFDNVPIFPNKKMLKPIYEDKDLGINSDFSFTLDEGGIFFEKDELRGMDFGITDDIFYDIDLTSMLGFDDYFEDSDFTLEN